MNHLNAWPSWIVLLHGWQVAPQPRPQGEIQRWSVYRETARYKRKVGYLDGNFCEEKDEESPLPAGVADVLIKLYNRRKQLDEKRLFTALAPAAALLSLTPESLAQQLVIDGWLGRWVRLKADEKSVSSVEYGPLTPLIKLLQFGRNEVLSENGAWLREMFDHLEQLRRDTGLPSGTEPDEGWNDGKAPLTRNGYDKSPAEAGEKALQVVREALERTREYLSQNPDDPPKEGATAGNLSTLHPLFPWAFHPLKPRGKFHLGVEFLLALAGCVQNSPEGFEWKEIGARFDPGIGGSKRFDAARDELLGLTEAVCGIPPEELGLTSTGSLYCLYFLGPLGARFPAGTLTAGPAVNALTNVQLQQLTSLATTAERVLLTENRALLLKMASTGWTADHPPTLVLGIDGRLRLAHTRFLNVLRECYPGLPWFAWVDTDPAGLAIAGQIAAINPRCRFLLPAPQTTILDHATWRQALEGSPSLWNKEQEGNLGHPLLWHEWFKP